MAVASRQRFGRSGASATNSVGSGADRWHRRPARVAGSSWNGLAEARGQVINRYGPSHDSGPGLAADDLRERGFATDRPPRYAFEDDGTIRDPRRITSGCPNNQLLPSALEFRRRVIPGGTCWDHDARRDRDCALRPIDKWGAKRGLEDRSRLARSRSGVASQEKLVLFSGRANSPTKGADVLLEAAHRLWSSGRSDIRVAFAGPFWVPEPHRRTVDRFRDRLLLLGIFIDRNSSPGTARPIS